MRLSCCKLSKMQIFVQTLTIKVRTNIGNLQTTNNSRSIHTHQDKYVKQANTKNLLKKNSITNSTLVYFMIMKHPT